MFDRYHIVREDLHRLYGGRVPADTIDSVLDEEIAAAEQRATVDTFLPVMVSRVAADRLESAFGAEAPAHARPEVLFVSASNAGRSQLAAVITHHLADEEVFVRAIGLAPTGAVDANVLEVMEQRGLSSDACYLEAIKARTVHRANVIVLMGVDQAPDLPGDRYVHWTIEDPVGKSITDIHRIADQIEDRVRDLLTELGVLVSAAA
ncbi:arsenate-mycothiol transferase ArsC [Corynebacterium uterequi]|uniref:Protein-tyrosine-phosphatase n=1 Tax=Corynebacterium uterequi TaxID=1072256 RepID=A0A0G3HFG5_9CORY|nr:hypothetical protein [Corynebacterium uterequi]AKK12054.1 protein-tyrosine-phosphatase [Corynebacterium uterequi]